MSYAATRYQQGPLSRRAHLGSPEELASRQHIHRQRRGRSPDNRRRRGNNRIIGTASRDIVNLIRGRYRGFLDAMNFKDAVGQLFKRLRHSKSVIKAAFSRLLKQHIVLEEVYGYRLKANVRVAA